MITASSSPSFVLVVVGLLGLLAGTTAAWAAQRMLPALPLRASWRAGLVPTAATAGLCALMAWRFGVSWLLPALMFLSAAGIALSRIDLQLKLLPNRIVMPSLGMGLALLSLDAAINQKWISLFVAFVGAAATFLIYLVLAVISPRGMGMGDVKFSALLGLYLGYLSVSHLVLGVLLGFLAGALTGFLLFVSGVAGRKTAVPFGPSMFAGCIAAVTFGPEIGRVILPTLFT